MVLWLSFALTTRGKRGDDSGLQVRHNQIWKGDLQSSMLGRGSQGTTWPSMMQCTYSSQEFTMCVVESGKKGVKLLLLYHAGRVAHLRGHKKWQKPSGGHAQSRWHTVMRRFNKALKTRKRRQICVIRYNFEFQTSTAAPTSREIRRKKSKLSN